MCASYDRQSETNQRLRGSSGRPDAVLLRCRFELKRVYFGRREILSPQCFMNEEKLHPDDSKLSALLRESRAQSPLPPRFQEGVWRRIEEAEAPVEPAHTGSWVDAMVAWALRPRFAIAAAIVLIVAGSLVGVNEGRQMARREAEIRYVSSVAPNSLR